MAKPSLKPVSEQVVVVMGASSGIGRATAARFAAEGAQVVASARGEAGLHSLVEQIRAAGGEAVAEVADVTDPEQMERVAARAVAEYGRLDTWVHLAGVALFAPFERITPEEFRRVVDVNLLGQVHGARAALPHLKREGGASIHVSSMGAKRGVPLQTAYIGFEAHDTGQPKAEDAPDNLFAPLDAFSTVEDGFGDSALRRSVYTSLQRHPVARRIPVAVATLATVGLALRSRGR